LASAKVRTDACGLAVAFLVGSALALQGWKSRVPSLDLIPHLEDAEALVNHGVIPEKGCLSSYAAYIPPGPTWLFAPGIALHLPARLVEYPASLTLFAVTAIGICALGNLCFGRPVGIWSAAIYCLSDRGLFFASSLWPRGHPAFVVWFVVFLCLWVKRQDAKWLGAAILVFAVGNYVFMEILPAGVAAVFVWLRYKPPIRPAPIVLSLAASLLVWSPYLMFEAKRDFRDLRAILARTSLPLDDPKPMMCDPEAKIYKNGEVVWPTTDGKEPARISAGDFVKRAEHFAKGLSENFPFAWGSAPLWLLLISIGLGMRFGGVRRDADSDMQQGVLWRILLIPWLLLLLLPEADAALAGRRFWWLWPLQIAAAIGALSIVLRRVPEAIHVGAVVLFSLAVASGAANRVVDSRTKHGFPGMDAELWSACHSLAFNSKTDRVRVSYVVEVWGHAFMFRVIDPRYKIGMEWDWLLRYDFGMRNEINCPEGVSAGADWEVVEHTAPASFAPKIGPHVVVLKGKRYSLHRRK
jgi:hypothetical protein